MIRTSVRMGLNSTAMDTNKSTAFDAASSPRMPRRPLRQSSGQKGRFSSKNQAIGGDDSPKKVGRASEDLDAVIKGLKKVQKKQSISPKKKKTNHKLLSPVPSSPAPRLPSIEDTREEDRKTIEKLEQQLKEQQERKEAEIEAIRKEVKQFKKETKANLKAHRAARVNGDETTSFDLMQNEKQIDLLRKENAKIREGNLQLRKNWKNLKVNNDRLQQSQDETKGLFSKLQEHHDRVKDEHDKLEAALKDLMKRTAELQEEVDTVTLRMKAERNMGAAYKRVIFAANDIAQESGDKKVAAAVAAVVDLFTQQYPQSPPSSPMSVKSKAKLEAGKSPRKSPRKLTRL